MSYPEREQVVGADAHLAGAYLVAVRRGDEDRPEIKALVEALQDGAVDTFNENTGAGIVAIK